MAYDATKIRGFTQSTGGNTGFAGRIFTVSYDGPSADWVASADLKTDMLKRGADEGDGILLNCSSGNELHSFGLLADNAGDFELQTAAFTVVT